jgi:hypothetical protein
MECLLFVTTHVTPSHYMRILIPVMVMMFCLSTLAQIRIICPELCVDHLATLLYYNSTTLEEIRFYPHSRPDEASVSNWTVPPSNGSFNWSLIDKPRSLILPRCEWFDIEIGSELLMNSLYLPSVYHMEVRQ